MIEHSIEQHHKHAPAIPSDHPHDPVDALAAEMRALDAMPSAATPMPQRMAASALEVIELFRVRAGIFSAHVESLVRALAHDGDLQPLLVLRRGEQVFLIDGRHRMEAYEQAGRSSSIPVVEFQGTPQEALLEGQRLNKMHTLGMTKDERMDCAWKLVKLDAAGACRFTIQMVMAVGVSRGQVTFMRRVLRELEDGFEHESWKSAQRAHSQKPERDYTDEEIEDMMDAQAQEAADKIARILGTRLADRPEVMARVLEIYTGRRIGEVVRILNERNDSGDMDGTDDDEFPDF